MSTQKSSSFLRLLIFLFFSIIAGHNAGAQIQQRFTLDDVVNRAQETSVDAFRAQHQYRGSFWRHRSYRATYLPQLGLDASIPNLNRSITPVTLPDGSDVFVRRSLATSAANLSLTQSVGLTGGQIFLNSGLQRIDLIRDSVVTSYSSTPISIGFMQPLFGFNTYKWERQIEPLHYKEAQRQYIEDKENIAIRATNHFFDLLNAQINLEISQTNYTNNDTLYKIAQGRYSLGKIAENDLLEMELNFLNAQSRLEQSKIDYQHALFRLRSYLSLDGNSDIVLELPVNVPDLTINADIAIQKALDNRPDAIAFRKNVIEAERELARAKAENRLNINLYAAYGLAQTGPHIPDVYQNPLDQQQLMVGVQVPILDWGVAKGRVKMAESFRELVETNVNQAKIDFKQEIYLKALHFNMLQQQLEVAAKADTVALKRYQVTKQRFLIGRIDIIPLNLAQEAKDLAAQGYINALRNYWTSYYEMRRLTHYDFLYNKPIEYEFSGS